VVKKGAPETPSAGFSTSLRKLKDFVMDLCMRKFELIGTQGVKFQGKSFLGRYSYDLGCFY
jgi:hypothetical protein